MLFIACKSSSVDMPNEDTLVSGGYIEPKVTTVNEIIYNTLTDTQKSIYKDLVNCYANFNSSVTITGTDDDIKIAHQAIIADRPEIFYVNGYVTDASFGALFLDEKEYTLYPNYTCSKDEYDTTLAKINEKTDAWLAEFDALDDYTISKYAFDVIAKNTVYKTDSAYSQNMVSVFEYGQSVCGGYSQAYSYLLQKMGVPCAMIIGELSDVAHSWNISILDGQYYLTDLTNGDSYYEINGKRYDYNDYSYLNINPEYLPNYAVSKLFNRIKVSATEDNYYYKENLHIDVFLDEQIDAGVETALANNMSCVTFQFEEKTLETAKEKLLNLAEMREKYGVTHVKLLDSFNTITLYFDYETAEEINEDTSN